jgi:hypothetical protein
VIVSEAVQPSDHARIGRVPSEMQPGNERRARREVDTDDAPWRAHAVVSLCCVPTMTNLKSAPSPLLAAAQMFDSELAHLEDLATQLERAPISSEKTLLRSGALLDEAGKTHERLGGCLTSLVAAIETTRVRQQAALDRVLEETRRVQARNNEYRELMLRFAALGARAREANGPVSEVVARKDAGASPDDLLTALSLVETLTQGVLNDADLVVQTAKEGNWPEIARDAHALRQSMHAARNKIVLVGRDVASRATS